MHRVRAGEQRRDFGSQNRLRRHGVFYQGAKCRCAGIYIGFDILHIYDYE